MCFDPFENVNYRLLAISKPCALISTENQIVKRHTRNMIQYATDHINNSILIIRIIIIVTSFIVKSKCKIDLFFDGNRMRAHKKVLEGLHIEQRVSQNQNCINELSSVSIVYHVYYAVLY